MLTRRGLLAVLAGAVVDPERLLWEPGRKLISIPQPRVLVEVSEQDLWWPAPQLPQPWVISEETLQACLPAMVEIARDIERNIAAQWAAIARGLDEKARLSGLT